MGETVYYTEICSPVGRLTLASDHDGENLAGLWIEGQKYFGDITSCKRIDSKQLPVFQSAKEWLERYFAGDKTDAKELPLNPAGSSYQQSVWEILCEIPYGQTVTYGEIARKLAASLGKETMSAQAAGGAVGRNPIGIIIPCHRVVGADGSLTGYAGGLDVKAKLLTLEGVHVEGGFVLP